MTLFGIKLETLFLAIAKVESDRGATSANVYQIRDIYIADVNRIMTNKGWAFFPSFRCCDKFCKSKSEDMMRVYWSWWGIEYEKSTANKVTPEVLARIHNGGPLGWKKPETLPYWNKVKAVLDRIEKNGGHL